MVKRSIGACLTTAVISFLPLSLVAVPVSASPLRAENVTVANRLPEELVDAFNVQIKSELDGAHFYLAMSNLCYLKSLDGFGFWFSQQYYEELNHARIMMDYLKRKGAASVLTVVDAPEPLVSREPAGLFQKSLELEQQQSGRIFDLAAKATALNAPDAASFLKWFIDEQVEEEDRFQAVLDRLILVQNSPEGVLLIDKDLGLRLPAVVWNPGQPLPPH